QKKCQGKKHEDSSRHGFASKLERVTFGGKAQRNASIIPQEYRGVSTGKWETTHDDIDDACDRPGRTEKEGEWVAGPRCLPLAGTAGEQRLKAFGLGHQRRSLRLIYRCEALCHVHGQAEVVDIARRNGGRNGL